MSSEFSGTSQDVIRYYWNDTEKVSMAPAPPQLFKQLMSQPSPSFQHAPCATMTHSQKYESSLILAINSSQGNGNNSFMKEMANAEGNRVCDVRQCELMGSIESNRALSLIPIDIQRCNNASKDMAANKQHRMSEEVVEGINHMNKELLTCKQSTIIDCQMKHTSKVEKVDVEEQKVAKKEVKKEAKSSSPRVKCVKCGRLAERDLQTAEPVLAQDVAVKESASASESIPVIDNRFVF